MFCCSVLSVGGDGMFAEVVHGLLSNALKKASGSEQPSVDTILPQLRWRIGIIPAGMPVFQISLLAIAPLFVVDVWCFISMVLVWYSRV